MTMEFRQKQTKEEIEQLYREDFDPDDYVKTYYSNMNPEYEFFLTNMHDFFNSKSVHEGCGSATKSVLEFGSGPVPILMFSASRWSENIISSDYSETSRLKLSQWLKLENGKYDQEDQLWLPFARFVHKLEQGSSSSEKDNDDDAGDDASAAQQLLNRIRNSVRAVVPCDYCEEDPLMGWAKEKFDVVITSFCLECTSSLEDYSKALKNIVNLLRPSGHLIIQGGLGANYTIHNHKKYPTEVCLDRSKVDAALTKAGCMMIDWKEQDRYFSPEEKLDDYSALFHCLAVKTEGNICGNLIDLKNQRSPYSSSPILPSLCSEYW